jgi:hypothetical protein
MAAGAIQSESLQGALLGGASAAAVYGVGSAKGPLGNALGISARSTGAVTLSAAMHGTVGGLVSVAQGGKFQSGFLAAGLSDYAGPDIVSNDATFSEKAAATVQAAVVGGIGSVLGGGKFANGAVTGAFGYLFNYLSHGRDISTSEGRSVAENAAEWKSTPYAEIDTPNSGANAICRVGADCSGSTNKIFEESGLNYEYKTSANFATAAAKEGFPFRVLESGEAHQPGDVVLFNGHMAIYAGQDNGVDRMWSASSGKGQYIQMDVKNFGKPALNWFRYRVQTHAN